jgi:hypothetical protein
MRSLRAVLNEENISNPEKVCQVVEDYIADLLTLLDNEASILAEKNDGDQELVMYYAGKGMNCRDVARMAGISINWKPLTYRSEDDEE